MFPGGSYFLCNDLKHSSESTTEWLKKKRVKVIQNSDLSLMLWWDLEKAVLRQMYTNLREQKQFYKEEWTETPQQQIPRTRYDYV